MEEKETLLPEMSFTQAQDGTYTGEYLVDGEVKQNGWQPFASYEEAKSFAHAWFKQNGVEKGKITFLNASKTDSMGEIYEANPEPAFEAEPDAEAEVE